MRYAAELRVRDARAQYFAASGFSTATYTDRWVTLAKLGPLPLGFPNSASRRRAIPLHDLHHVATEYATTFVGEAEIGAWEVAAGCANHVAAWVLDAGAMACGLVLAPRLVYRAFVRGRHSRALYREGWSDALLELSVGELRARLGLDAPHAATARDRFAFAAWVIGFAAPPLLVALAVIHCVQ
ncbi:MAG TPA: hypothetical protein VGM88_04720 [Kofleriaceae bacterium]|jgi:hypothetical protein